MKKLLSIASRRDDMSIAVSPSRLTRNPLAPTDNSAKDTGAIVLTEMKAEMKACGPIAA
jgi:hypothetical protein